MLRRFDIRPRDVPEMAKVAEMWVDGLDVYLSKLELNRRIGLSIDRLGGDDVDVMRHSSEAAASFLCHHDPGRRNAALMALRRMLGKATHLADRVRERIVLEQDPKVRLTAVYTFNALKARSADRAAARFLAGLVRDRTDPVGIRFAAYEGLFSVMGMGIHSPIARLGDDPSQFSSRLQDIVAHFDDFVDWELVDRWIREGSG